MSEPLDTPAPAPKKRTAKERRSLKTAALRKLNSNAKAPLGPGVREHFRRLDESFRANPLMRPKPDDEVLWAWGVFDDDEVVGTEAPSRGAWTMLWIGRADRMKFFKEVVQPALKRLSERERERDTQLNVGEEERNSIETIRADIKAAVLASRKLK